MKASFYHVFDPEAELARWDWIHSPAELRCYSIRLSSVPHAVASIVREEGAALGLTSGRLRSANGTVNAKSEMLVQGTEKSLKELSEKLKRSGGEAAACGESILGLLRRARRRLPGLLQLGRHRLPLGKRTLIMGILSTGMIMIGLNEYWQWVVKGLVLIFAVTMSNLGTNSK